MYCSKCGKENADGSIFCKKCGAKLEETALEETKNDEITQEEGQSAESLHSNKKPLPIVWIDILVIVLIVAGGIAWNRTFDERFQTKIESYISKENYEKAETYYQKVKAGHSKNENIYLCGADIYLAQDMYTEAIEVLDEGIAETNSEELTERKTYVCEHVMLKEELWNEGNWSTGDEYEYEYDATGNMTKQICYNSDGNIEDWNEYEYDATGNMTKQICYNSDGNIENWHEYDTAGNETKWIFYDSDGSITYWHENEYDVAGNPIKQTLYFSDGSIYNWEYEYEYEYDAAGNLTKVIRYGSDGNIAYCEYDTAGNETKWTFYDSDGSITYWLENEYDVVGNKTKGIEYASDGSIDYSITYTYTYTGTLLGDE